MTPARRVPSTTAVPYGGDLVRVVTEDARPEPGAAGHVDGGAEDHVDALRRDLRRVGLEVRAGLSRAPCAGDLPRGGVVAQHRRAGAAPCRPPRRTRRTTAPSWARWPRPPPSVPRRHPAGCPATRSRRPGRLRPRGSLRRARRPAPSASARPTRPVPGVRRRRRAGGAVVGRRRRDGVGRGVRLDHVRRRAGATDPDQRDRPRRRRPVRARPSRPEGLAAPISTRSESAAVVVVSSDVLAARSLGHRGARGVDHVPLVARALAVGLAGASRPRRTCRGDGRRSSPASCRRRG